MFRFMIIIFYVLSCFLISGCFDKIYPTQTIQDSNRNDMGIKNPVIVYLHKSISNYISIYANGQLVCSDVGSTGLPDSLIVPDSSYLYARWGTNHADTIASPGLVWTIQ